MELVLNWQKRLIGIETYDFYEKDNPYFSECLDTIDKLDFRSIVLSQDLEHVDDINLINAVREKSKNILTGVDLSAHVLNGFSLYNDISNNIFDIPILLFGPSYPPSMKVDVQFLFSTGKNYTTAIICSPNYPKNCAESSLMHEYGHVLIVEHPGVLKNYVHNEYISVVLQLLYPFINKEYDAFKETLRRRLYFLKRDIQLLNSDYTQYPDTPCYVQSTLEAFLTVSEFLESSQNDQDAMLSDIRKVLNGEVGVEKYIDENDVAFRSESKNKIKKLIDMAL